MPDTRWFKKTSTYKYLWVGFFALTLTLGGVGIALQGLDFFTDPLPLPTRLARYWLSVHGLMFILIWVLALKNLLKFEEHWTMQERMISRGIVLIAFGSAGGHTGQSPR